MLVVSIALCRKGQSFGATIKFDPHFFSLLKNGIIQTFLVAFSIKNVWGIYRHVVIKMMLSNSQKQQKPQTAHASRAP